MIVNVSVESGFIRMNYKYGEGQHDNVVDLAAERRKRRTDAGDEAYMSNMKVLWDTDVDVHDNDKS
jgi:hypothetical protein